MATREIGTSMEFGSKLRIAKYPGLTGYPDMKVIQWHAENVAVAGETIISDCPKWVQKQEGFILWAFICINMGLPFDGTANSEAIMDATITHSAMGEIPCPGLWFRRGAVATGVVGAYGVNSETRAQFYPNLWIPIEEDDYLFMRVLNNQVSGPAATDNYCTVTCDLAIIEKR